MVDRDYSVKPMTNNTKQQQQRLLGSFKMTRIFRRILFFLIMKFLLPNEKDRVFKANCESLQFEKGFAEHDILQHFNDTNVFLQNFLLCVLIRSFYR